MVDFFAEFVQLLLQAFDDVHQFDQFAVVAFALVVAFMAVVFTVAHFAECVPGVLGEFVEVGRLEVFNSGADVVKASLLVFAGGAFFTMRCLPAVVFFEFAVVLVEFFEVAASFVSFLFLACAFKGLDVAR